MGGRSLASIWIIKNINGLLCRWFKPIIFTKGRQSSSLSLAHKCANVYMTQTSASQWTTVVCAQGSFLEGMALPRQNETPVLLSDWAV